MESYFEELKKLYKNIVIILSHHVDRGQKIMFPVERIKIMKRKNGITFFHKTYRMNFQTLPR